MKRRILLAAAVVVLAIGLWFSFLRSAPKQASKGQTTTRVSSPAVPVFDKNKYSLSDPASLWVVVNKSRALPNGYTPSDLVVPAVKLRASPVSQEMHVRQAAALAMENMFKAAAQEGTFMMLASGFRSQALQATLYNGYVASLGKAQADRSSALPGHSEHQTGWAADLEPANRKCQVQQCFSSTQEGQWLAANAYKYGFIIRYPADKEQITGYEYEPWHVRYVGIELAAQMHKTGITTLEEFFGLQ